MRMTGMLLALAGVFGVLAEAGERFAFAVDTKYDVRLCRAQNKNDDGNANLVRSVIPDPGSHRLFNQTGGTIKVICPIEKKTSGPTVTSGDAIAQVSVRTESGGGLIQCALNVWKTPIQFRSTPTALASRTSSSRLEARRRPTAR